jgi:hypothetical protein
MVMELYRRFRSSGPAHLTDIAYQSKDMTESSSNNSDKSSSSRKDTEKQPQDKSSRLFSHKEIKTIVKEFVRAYISGQVKVRLPIPSGKPVVNPVTPLVALAPEQSGEIADIMSKRAQLKDLIAICIGARNVTREEFDEVLNVLFNLIITMRLSEVLDGKFVTSAIETRLTSLENSVNDLVSKSNSTDMLVRRILKVLELRDHFDERKMTGVNDKS